MRSLIRTRAHLEFERRSAEQAGEWDQVDEVDGAIVEVEEALSTAPIRGRLTPEERKTKAKRKRSTKRRQDVPDLPRLPVETRTVGRAFRGRTGKAYRPSMFVTLTLGSYGDVHSAIRRGAYVVPCQCGQRHGERDELLGTPIDPDAYDYRRAALDAIHFAKVLDRFWQNTRRAAGFNVQYAGAIELQRRLTPHAHFCVRGTAPRALWRRIAEATYHQVWWPHFDEPLYTVDKPPVWNTDAKGYVDPRTGTPLPTWQQALDAIDEDPDSTPAYVVRLGRIDPRDVKGVEPGSKDAERTIRYVTKYVTKDITDHARARSDAQRAHADRLHAELSALPCAPTCANWLLYGVQPDCAKKNLVPGRCTGKVHQRTTFGFTGRRVLVSRQWSTKTLADIRADNAAWVRAILAGHGDDHDQAVTDTAPSTRYVFELARPDDPDVPPYQLRILRAISARIRWRDELSAARARAAARAAPPDVSATAA